MWWLLCYYELLSAGEGALTHRKHRPHAPGLCGHSLAKSHWLGGCCSDHGLLKCPVIVRYCLRSLLGPSFLIPFWAGNCLPTNDVSFLLLSLIIHTLKCFLQPGLIYLTSFMVSVSNSSNFLNSFHNFYLMSPDESWISSLNTGSLFILCCIPLLLEMIAGYQV